MASLTEEVRQAYKFFGEGLARGVITTLDVLEEGIHSGKVPYSDELMDWVKDARMGAGEFLG